MRILGVHDGHNASACLLMDGKIVHAAEEKRLTRIKNHCGFPVAATTEILDQTGLDIAEIDYVALSGHLSLCPRTSEELKRRFRQAGSLRSRFKGLTKPSPANHLFRFKHKRERVAEAKALGFPEDKVVLVEHQAAHAAAAYYGSPFGDEKVLVLTNDIAGDSLCATVSVGCNGRIRRLVGIGEASSLGLVYTTVTFLLGMDPYQDECKVMESGAYARGRAADKSHEAFRRLLHFNTRNPMLFERRGGVSASYDSISFIKRLVEIQRFDEVAAGLQRWTEEILQGWVKNCLEATGIRKVALSGSVFRNAKASKAISEIPEIEQISVFPSCGDETNALGAAFWLYARSRLSNVRPIDITPVGPIYWGRAYSDYEAEESLLGRRQTGYFCVACENIENEVAGLLASGKVVARMKGRAEFGANALGNRSILADPARPHLRRVIGDTIGNWDFWMPLPCSVLKERERDYILNPKSIPCPHMMMSYNSTSKARDIMAAVNPYDLTLRPQIVDSDCNPDYYHLLKRFQALTGRGAVLNIPFSLPGHPVVASPEDALEAFEKSGLEYLALGNFLLSKRPLELRRPREEVAELPRRMKSMVEWS